MKPALLILIILIFSRHSGGFYSYTIKDYSLYSEYKYSTRQTDWLGCVSACQEDEVCWSYSYRHSTKTDEGGGHCELNNCYVRCNEVKEFLVYTPGFVFQQIKPEPEGKQHCVKRQKAVHNNTCKACCKQGWETYGENCYKFIAMKRSWADAESYCNGEGGHLASIHTLNENEDILRLAATGNPDSTAYFWVGLNDIVSGTKYVWSDGSALSVFSRWETNEPNSVDECGNIRLTDGLWLDFMCSKENSFVCKYTRA